MSFKFNINLKDFNHNNNYSNANQTSFISSLDDTKSKSKYSNRPTDFEFNKFATDISIQTSINIPKNENVNIFEKKKLNDSCSVVHLIQHFKQNILKPNVSTYLKGISFSSYL